MTHFLPSRIQLGHQSWHLVRIPFFIVVFQSLFLKIMTNYKSEKAKKIGFKEKTRKFIARFIAAILLILPMNER